MNVLKLESIKLSLDLGLTMNADAERCTVIVIVPTAEQATQLISKMNENDKVAKKLIIA